MSKTTQKKRTLRLFSTGFTMGLADLVPGVSGGTIAFLFGIYDELLHSIRLMTGQVPKLFLTGKFKEAIGLIPFMFLLPLGLGLVLAIFGLARGVSFLLDAHPMSVWAFFFGLVSGSAYVVSKRVTIWTAWRSLLAVFGFVLTFVLMSLPPLTGSITPLAVFLTGMIAITAMILPGISGSLIMILFGQYEVIINAVAQRNIFVLVVFAVGAVVGLALFVRLLIWLMKRYYFAVISFLVGVMCGSLRRLWPWQTDYFVDDVSISLPTYETSVLWVIFLAVLGFAIVYGLGYTGIAEEQSVKNKS